MIKIVYKRNNTIDTTLLSEVDYYTKDNLVKTVYFLGIKLYSVHTKVNTKLIKNSSKSKNMGFNQ